MTAVLVTGGAGYIGSHTTRQLLDAGHSVTVLDNLYSGFEGAVDPRASFVRGDIADQGLVCSLLQDQQIEAVVHFAGHIVVPESVADPLKYYNNNVAGSLVLLQSCLDSGVQRFVFSSSAAVYGMPDQNPIDESVTPSPINPYGTTKLITEWTLRDLAAASADFRYVALRYFNVAGAHIGGELGQSTPEATHLIKVACEAACGKRDGMAIYGDDYDTPDGTCIRDYIHVDDLARAHLDALSWLANGGRSMALNCGYGRGHSVREVVDRVREVSGVDFPVSLAGRRAGDPAALVADNTQIRQMFGWQPRYDDLALICRTAYQWERTLEGMSD
jgi:UDP-glucose 4-epimerase